MERFLYFINNVNLMTWQLLLETVMLPNSVIHQPNVWIERKNVGHLHFSNVYLWRHYVVYSLPIWGRCQNSHFSYYQWARISTIPRDVLEVVALTSFGGSLYGPSRVCIYIPFICRKMSWINRTNLNFEKKYS